MRTQLLTASGSQMHCYAIRQALANALGVKSAIGNLPDNSEPITVYSQALYGYTKHTFKQRLYATCACCKREIPAGKMRQHYAYKHADVLQADMADIRQEWERKRQAQAHKQALDLVCVGVDSREAFL